MSITETHIRKALQAVPGALGGQMKSLSELAEGANSALLQAPAGLTVKGAAAFLATMAQESAWFRTTEEYDKTQPYAPYIGRTFEQITWENNYLLFGLWCKAKGLLADPEQFVKNPKSLADYKWAWLGGVWYFEHAKLWDEANSGNFLGVQKGVNLGDTKSPHTPAGWATRKAAYEAFLSIGDDLMPGRTVYVVDSKRKPPPSDRPKFTVKKYPVVKKKINGYWTTDRGWAMYLEACKLYTAKTGKKAPGITQGGWNNTVGASAGTHSREAFDFATAALTDEQNRIWERCCRTVGFASWWRRVLKGVWSEHNHSLPKGGILVSGAVAQVKAFALKRDGLAGNRPDPTIGSLAGATFEKYLTARDAPKHKINGKVYADFGDLSVKALNEAWVSGEFSRRVYVIQDWLNQLGLYKAGLDGDPGMLTKGAFNEFRRKYLGWNESDSTGLPGIKSVEWLCKFVNSSRKVVA